MPKESEKEEKIKKLSQFPLTDPKEKMVRDRIVEIVHQDHLSGDVLDGLICDIRYLNKNEDHSPEFKQLLSELYAPLEKQLVAEAEKNLFLSIDGKSPSKLCFFLDKHPLCPQKEAATALGKNPKTMTNLVTKLYSVGMINVRPYNCDNYLSLGPRGIRYVSSRKAQNPSKEGEADGKAHEKSSSNSNENRVLGEKNAVDEKPKKGEKTNS